MKFKPVDEIMKIYFDAGFVLTEDRSSIKKGDKEDVEQYEILRLIELNPEHQGKDFKVAKLIHEFPQEIDEDWNCFNNWVLLEGLGNEYFPTETFINLKEKLDKILEE